MGRTLAIIAVTVAILIASQQAAFTQTLSGRLTTSFYAWERQPTDSTSTTHVRAYQLAVLDLKQFGHRFLSFHTFLRWQGDLVGDFTETSNYRVKNVYAEWRDRGRGYGLKGGRVRVYAGVANVLVDGLWAGYEPTPSWKLEGFVGVQAPPDQAAIFRNWERNRTFGFRVLTHQLDESLTASFSAMRRDRDPIRYEEPGIYTGIIPSITYRQQELLGYDITYLLRSAVRFDHQLEYDLLQHQLHRVTVSAYLAPTGARWTGDVSYLYRAPVMDRNSILSVFNHHSYDEIEVRGGYSLRDGWRLYGDYAYTALEDDDTQRFSLGTSYQRMNLSYSMRTGYSGDSDAIVLGYAHPWNQALTLRLQTGLTSLRFTGDESDRDWTWMLAVSGQGRLRRNLTIDLEIQNLTQEVHERADFAGYRYDLRSYLKLSYWFSAGAKTRSVF